MPARTLNDFLAGFFYGRIGLELEVKMAIPFQKVQGKVNQIKVEGECQKRKGGNRSPRKCPPEMESMES